MKKPDLSNIQLFGCNAYVKTLGQIKKLDDRCKKYTLVGYASNGYRLFDTEKEKLIMSRDVIFKATEQGNSKNTKLKIPIKLDETSDTEDKILEEEEDSEENLECLESDEEIEIKERTHEDSRKLKETEKLVKQQQGKTRPEKRERKLPERLKDYVLLTYKEATEGAEKIFWKKAIEEEKYSLKQNKVWTIVPRTEAGNKKVLTNGSSK